jgi:hypothetical protein
MKMRKDYFNYAELDEKDPSIVKVMGIPVTVESEEEGIRLS